MIKRLLFLVVSGSLLCVHAASPAIGFVRSNGEFRVDGATVRGNSTLSEGNVIETAGVRSTLELNGGQMTLGLESRIRVYRGRTILEKGSGMLRDAVALVMEAGSLR